MSIAGTAFLAFVTAVVLTYAAVVALLVIGLWRFRMDRRRLPSRSDMPFISVIVAARNEGKNVDACLRSLLDQDYPRDRYEILFVDDHSSDDTRARAESYLPQASHLRVIALADLGQPRLTGKQHALDLGIRRSRGEIIASTDADCTPPPTWLSQLASRFDERTGIVVGFSTLDAPSDRAGLFVKVQSLELLGLFSAFAASLRWGIALACTGNNLAYRRAAYEELGGFTKMGFTVAEDNMFLQWVNRHTSWDIHVGFSQAMTVRTLPMPTFSAFLGQRLRWASNSLENRFSAVWFMVVAYGVNLLVPVALVLAAVGAVSWPWALGLAALKGLPEVALLWRGLRLFERRDLLLYLPFVGAFHSLYVLIVGMAGLTGKVVWKGRAHQMQRRHDRSS